MAKIGYQNGVEAAKARMKKLDPGGFRADGTGAWDKFFRTIKHLVDEHDAEIPDEEPPPPPPSAPRLAPMTHYKAGTADARYCVHAPGVTQIGPDEFRDEGGFRYTENGLCRGGRSGQFVAVLKGADSMDGLEPCMGYTKDGRVFPPWPPESYQV